jgi:hypothetical protein
MSRISARISQVANSELNLLAAERSSNKTNTVAAAIHTLKFLKDKENQGGTILIQLKNGSFEKVTLP